MIRYTMLVFLFAAVSLASPPRSRRSLAQLSEMSSCLLDMSIPEYSLKYGDYGCFCGAGGQGTPLDGTDACCQGHDNCYTTAGLTQCKFELQPLSISYKYESGQCGTINAYARCLGPEAYEADFEDVDCAMAVCACDRDWAATCFVSTKSTYNNDYRGHDKKTCV